MFLVAIVLLGAMTVPLLRGRLGDLADVKLRMPWILMVALGLQTVSIYLPGLPFGGREVLQTLSYPVAGCFLWFNRSLPGVVAVALGGALNLLAISANGGRMPASPTALRAAGMPLDPGGYSNSAALPHPRLLFIGDVFSVPHTLPLSNVFSVGDVLIALGVAYAIHRICNSHLPFVERGVHERHRRRPSH